MIPLVWGAHLASTLGLPVFAFVVLMLCVSGSTLAAVFALAAAGRIERDILGRRCVEGSCASVLELSDARLIFGIPNGVVGLAFYLLVAVWVLGMPFFGLWGYFVALGASVLSVLMGVRLLWGLHRARARCVLCVAAHGINVTLLLVLMLRALR